MRTTPRRARVRLPAAAVATAAALSACYEYTPPVTSSPTPGTEVRLTLTDAGSVAAASAVGPHVELVDGRIGKIDADSVVVMATQTTQRGGTENLWSGERVSVPRSSVASLGVRRISASRTALAAAVGVAVVVGTFVGFKIGQAGTSNNTTQVPTPK